MKCTNLKVDYPDSVIVVAIKYIKNRGHDVLMRPKFHWEFDVILTLQKSSMYRRMFILTKGKNKWDFYFLNPTVRL